jgi:hypothetical protein
MWQESGIRTIKKYRNENRIKEEHRKGVGCSENAIKAYTETLNNFNSVVRYFILFPAAKP